MIKQIALGLCTLLGTGFLWADDAPPNEPATVAWTAGSGSLTLRYGSATILAGTVSGEGVDLLQSVTNTVGSTVCIEQRLVLHGKGVTLSAQVRGSTESLAAETLGVAQKNFPLVRTSHGVSRSLRNNAIYDRRSDWELEAPADGSTRIMPIDETRHGRTFSLAATGDTITLTFRPRFYQKHKGLTYFEPWTYPVRQDSISGWCSWWAYCSNFNEAELKQILAVWSEKHLRDFGYRFIQIDDTYQQTNGCMPEGWLNWNDKFPSGIRGYSKGIRAIGCEPGVWTHVTFTVEDVVNQHPDWFVRDDKGAPYKARFVYYGIDATKAGAADTVVRPTYHGFHKNDISYVKIDGLRHLRYDSLNQNPNYATSQGSTSAEIFRKYLKVVREELGPDTYMLASWGMLQDAIGLVDGCRIGGDGYGPLTLQHYNSWNGIVWRNDPDHCDIRPQQNGADVGDVTHFTSVEACDKDTVLRPTLASVAGAMLMLSDKAEVYQHDAYLEGAKRAAPVLSSVPGQLYDFNPEASDKVKSINPDTVNFGGKLSPFDAERSGAVNAWWLNEISMSFEYWSVLTRMNWTDGTLPATTITFADLGLDPSKDYLVYEFWRKHFVGVCKGSFDVPASGPKDTHTFAIREKLDRPQIVSTSRHISQGGVDLLAMEWKAGTLKGRSAVVIQDRYEMTLYVPTGYALISAEIDGKSAEITKEGELVRVAFVPAETGSVNWRVTFQHALK